LCRQLVLLPLWSRASLLTLGLYPAPSRNPQDAASNRPGLSAEYRQRSTQCKSQKWICLFVPLSRQLPSSGFLMLHSAGIMTNFHQPPCRCCNQCIILPLLCQARRALRRYGVFETADVIGCYCLSHGLSDPKSSINNRANFSTASTTGLESPLPRPSCWG